MKDFIDQALTTESPNIPHMTPDKFRLLHAAMGMVTESGEFLDALKKHYFYNKALDRTNLLEEIGDQLWYMALALRILDSEFDEVMTKVINKLRARFPERFNDLDAQVRDLEAERKAMQ